MLKGMWNLPMANTQKNMIKKVKFKQKRTKFERMRTITGLIFLIPTTILCAMFILVPLLKVFQYSFYSWNGISPHMDFVGLYNYKTLPSTEGFFDMAKATVIYAFGVTFFVILFGFLLALVLDKRGRGRLPRGLMRTLWFFPCLLSGAVVGILWRIMFNYNNGVINSVLKTMGMEPMRWLETYGVTMWAIIIATVWSQMGLCIVIFMAGLQSIPSDMFEATAIDGASPRQVLWKLIIPMMAPSITINVLTTTIAAFKMYELPFIISQGLPGYSTRLLTQRVYFYAFEAMDYGIGSALSVVLVLIIMFISLIQLVALRKREDIY